MMVPCIMARISRGTPGTAKISLPSLSHNTPGAVPAGFSNALGADRQIRLAQKRSRPSGCRGPQKIRAQRLGQIFLEFEFDAQRIGDAFARQIVGCGAKSAGDYQDIGAAKVRLGCSR